MTKRKKINLKLYQCFVHFMVTDDIVKTVSRIYRAKGEKVPDGIEDIEGLCFNMDPDNYYVALSSDKLTVNTVSHEIYHLVKSILSGRAIDDEESAAWLCGMLNDEADKFYSKAKQVWHLQTGSLSSGVCSIKKDLPEKEQKME